MIFLWGTKSEKKLPEKLRKGRLASGWGKSLGLHYSTREALAFLGNHREHPFCWIQDTFRGFLHHLPLRCLQWKGSVGAGRAGLQPSPAQSRKEWSKDGLSRGPANKQATVKPEDWIKSERRSRTLQRWEGRIAVSGELDSPSTFVSLFSRFGPATVFGSEYFRE